MKLAYAICGSFCNHEASLTVLRTLINAGHDITPIFSERVLTTDTRFGCAKDFINAVEGICEKEGVKTLADAESVVTAGKFDCLIISPCTGNTMAKIALAVTDSIVPMAVKAHLRNRRPVLIALATNDGLSGSLKNIAQLIERKNVYFVPFGQDNSEKKPYSLVCDFSAVEKAFESAVLGIQTQPILL